MRETVVFNGIAYHRYPDSNSYTNRAYFTGSISGRTVRLHQEIFKYAKGDIPPGYHVHHKDGNTLNNSIENLVLSSEHDHHSHHTTECFEVINNGLRDFWKKQKYRQVQCPECGKIYNTRSTKDVKFCSSSCWNRFHYRKRHQKVD